MIQKLAFHLKYLSSDENGEDDYLMNSNIIRNVLLGEINSALLPTYLLMMSDFQLLLNANSTRIPS